MRWIVLPVVLAAGCVEPDLGAATESIIGGMPVAAGQHPAVGALYEAGVTCTGTLIAPDVVLTAAHCLRADAPLPGFTLATDARAAVTPLVAAAAVIHPMWDVDRAIPDGPTQFYDLAILRLAAPVTAVAPMILAGREGRALADGDEITMVGYGQTIDGEPGSAGVKVEAVAAIVATSASELQVSRVGEPQNCYGDSGGPAIADVGHGPRLVGVVSRGATVAPTCDQGTVDTRVDFYASWIRQQAPEVCIGDDPCAGGPGNGYGADVTGGCAASRGGGRGGALGIAIALLAVARRRRLLRRRAIE